MNTYRVAYIKNSKQFEIFVKENQLEDVLIGLRLDESCICCIEKWA